MNIPDFLTAAAKLEMVAAMLYETDEAGYMGYGEKKVSRLSKRWGRLHFLKNMT